MMDARQAALKLFYSRPDDAVRILSVSQSGEAMTIELAGEIRHDFSAQLMEWILHHHRQGQGRLKSLILNFRKILFLDSQGLALLFTLHKTLAQHDCALSVHQPAPHIIGLFELTRLGDHIEIVK